MITTINELKQLLENVEFTQDRVKSLNIAFDTLPSKYQNNKFFKSIISQLNKNNKLSKKQYDQLNFLLKHGQTMYEAGILITKN
jgi:arginyl-tRNA synthetase